MFLNSLTLKGFKSFAQTTTLSLEPGVTAVVGPNGSGKSNIVDAIAWVLGAQGPSALRSQKMDDVVFAGTQSLAALGRAEVTLVISNDQGELPIETAEVAITRRLYRSGDSEYLLNGTQCRLADLQELLSDVGVGRQQHIIVAQGQIEQVLSASPEQRRAIIEDAAGILKFRRRKERAERRLAATQENVARLSDLQRELKRQIRPLQRQSEGAKQHEQLAAEFEALRLYEAGRRLASLQSEQKRIAASQAELAADIAAKKALLAELDEAIAAAEKDEKEQTALGLAGGGSAGAADAATDTATATEAPDSLARVMALAERARGLLGQVYERLRATQRDKGAALAQDVVAAFTEESSRIEKELLAFETQRGEIAEELQAASAQETASAQEAAPGAPATDPSDITPAAAEQSLSETNRSVREISEELQRWVGRADALRLALDQARQSSGIAALQDAPGVIGILTDLIDVEPGTERALKAALGESLSAVVVQGADQAQVALQAQAALQDQTSETQPDAVTVLAVPGPASSPASPSPAAADAAAGASPAFTPLRRFVSVVDPANQQLLAPLLDGLLADTFTVEGDWRDAIKAALAHPKLTFVTERGDRCGPGGWRIGASTNAVTTAALTDAEKTIDQLRADLTAAEQAQAEAQTQRDATVAAQAERARLRYEHRATLAERDKVLSQRQTELTNRHQDIAIRLAGHDEAMAKAGDLQARLDAVIAGLTNLADRLTGTRERLSAAVRYLRQRDADRYMLLEQLRDRRDAHRRSYAETQADLTQLEATSASHDVESSALNTKLELLETSLTEELETDEQTVLAAPQPHLDPGVTAKQRLKQVRDLLKRLGPVNPLALSEFEELSERHEFVAGQLDDVRQSRRELIKVVKQIDAEIEVMFAGAFDDVKQTFERLFETLFPGGTGTLSLTSASASASAQADAAPAGTSQSAAGQSAAGEHSTEGIELDVCPSGKRVSRLSLLSGGERSLTALAFLFAVFRSRPSPFYILDEVEASLDDINLSRFLTLVSEFRNEVQLIIVTHQQRTMEFADVMYGVSMPPGKASNVVAERTQPATANPDAATASPNATGADSTDTENTSTTNSTTNTTAKDKVTASPGSP